MNEELRLALLVEDLLGCDEVKCVAARDALEAMGAFQDSAFRTLLAKAAQRPRDVSIPLRQRGSIGGFPVGGIIGRGGFAFVWRTEHEGVEACLKVGYRARAGAGRVTRLVSHPGPSSSGVPHDQACANGLRARGGGLAAGSISPDDVHALIQGEAAFLRGLEGDLFPKVHASGVEDDAAWYAMELLPGDSLRSVIRAGGGASIDLQLFARLARELGTMHGRDGTFFHGDLKPDNIILCGDRLRCIDPSARPETVPGLRGTTTVAYNPFGLAGESADVLALTLTLLEVRYGLAPYATYEQPCADLVTAAERLGTLTELRNTGGLARTLVSWIAEPPTLDEVDRTLRKAARSGAA